ncbi:secretin N-terminal domain-containing protein [Cupriavidus sp. CP313]
MMGMLRTVSLVLAMALAGCGTSGAIRESEGYASEGQYAESVEVLREQLRRNPDDVGLRNAYYRRLETLVREFVREADQALERGDDDAAIAALREVLAYDPANLGAQQEIHRIQVIRRLRPQLDEARELQRTDPQAALRRVQQVLDQLPNLREAQELREALMQRLASVDALSPKLSAALRKPVTLNFREQSLTSIFDLIARISGINFVLDKDINPNARASTSASTTTAEDAINLLLATASLQKQYLNADTILIYPARPDKEREYRSLAVRTFFLSHSDPRQAVAQIKQLFRPKEILVDDRLNGVVVRDSVETLQAIERLIQALDLPQSEVTLDVQVLEVARNDLLNLGIGYPGKITGTLSEAVNPGGLGVPVSALRNINAGNILLDAGSPQVTLNLLQRSGNTQTLANPKIRVRNREKATISIGERVPVVTTTNANGVVTESVQYQDVGLKLDVEPNISLSNEISIRLAMDVSNIISETVTRTGLITYVLGTRSAKTTLTARNNETQVLAGLIRRADIKAGQGLPGLSRVPVLDRIFGTRQDKQEQTEIVLLITPHIERSLDLPAFQVSTFASGTEARPGIQPLALVASEGVRVSVTPDPAGAAASGALPPPLALPASGNWQALPAPQAVAPVVQAPVEHVVQPSAPAPTAGTAQPAAPASAVPAAPAPSMTAPPPGRLGEPPTAPR